MAGRATKVKAVATAPEDWELLTQTTSAEQAVMDAKRGADEEFRVRRAIQANDELCEALDELERLRVACDDLGGPGRLEPFPSIPPPPKPGRNPLTWWGSDTTDAWIRQVTQSADRLAEILKVAWSALLTDLAPPMPGENILSNLEAASPDLKRACNEIRDLIARWDDLVRKRLPDEGDVAEAEAVARSIAESWESLGGAGAASERLELLTRLSSQPPSVTLLGLTQEEWDWLFEESGVAGSVYLTIREN